MTIKLSDMNKLLAEHDMAQGAASYGATASREVLGHVMRLLPEEELNSLRVHIKNAIDKAYLRTSSALNDAGVEVDLFENRIPHRPGQ